MDLLKRLQLLTRSALWAIKAEAVAPLLLNIVLDRAAQHAGVGALGWEAARPHSLGPKGNKIAVIPVQGVLTKDGPLWLGNNYDGINNALEQAGADPSVKRIVLSVDSPGGEVTGLPETAAALASVAKVNKPVSAIVEGMAASAAYWLTSQASDITLTPSGDVGSVGVRMMHVDVSKMLSDMGFNVTELYSGNYKTEWSPFHPLTDAAKADMQSRLDNTHKDFINAVAAGRGERASQEIRESRFGEGRMLSSGPALEHGLVDKLQSSREFYKAITPAEEDTGAPVYGLPRRAHLKLEKEKV